MAAIPAADPGEALPQVAAAEVLVDRLADDRPEEPVAILEALGVDLLEALVVRLDKPTENVGIGFDRYWWTPYGLEDPREWASPIY